MKALALSAALIAFAVLPGVAHPGHDHGKTYGVFWKPGTTVQKSAALPADVWRFAFVSKYVW